jgi:signal transduction histidine kinase
VLGIFVIASLFVTSGAILFSRRRLREQKRQREMAEHEFTAILSERNRLAREIHDTLAQGLGAISMQLELTKSRLAPEANGAGEHLEQAHQLVRSNLADARNAIWNMRSQVLETGNLASALTGVLQQLSGNTDVEGRMRVDGRLRRLPPVTENNLLRIGQEAITNAIKHAQAKFVEVVLEFADKEVRLRVKDNGRGFDTAQPPAGDSGFGLLGMRERAEELHGQLTVRSAVGHGTEVILVVPVAG